MQIFGGADLDLDQLRRQYGGADAVWVDLRDPGAEELDAVGEILGLHALAIEDSREFGQRPKLDRYGDRLLLVLFGLGLDGDGVPVPVELHIHVGPGAVLTVSRTPPASLERVRRTLEHDAACGEGALVYRIVDLITDTVSDTLGAVAQQIDGVAQRVFIQPRVSDRAQMAHLQRSLGLFHRTLAIQRPAFDRAVDQIAALAGDGEDLRPFLADIADHLSLASDDVDADRETLASMLDSYSNRVQERLTIVATIFLPLSALTGFFGMNFDWLVHRQDGAWMFFGLGIGGILLSCLLITAWLRHTGMIGADS